MKRRETSTVWVRDIPIGSGHPVIIQSMTNTKTSDIKATLNQIYALEAGGCEIVRVALPTVKEAGKPLEEIMKNSPIPVVADIHFDYQIALRALESGVDKLRLNPGNIKNADHLKEVVLSAKEKNVPIRVGVNSGSMPKHLLEKYNRVVNGASLAEACLEQVYLLESFGFKDIIISVKASSVSASIDALDILATKINYPFHIGITEAGGGMKGRIKSAVGIGSLLTKGYGDTLRVSLTDDPVEEIAVGQAILQSAGIRLFGPELISCPSCGRSQIDLIALAKQVEERLKSVTMPIRVAVMGCEVNGPGEARDADIGIAGGDKCGILFRKGEIIEKVNEDEIVDRLLLEIDRLSKEWEREERNECQ